MRIPSGSTDKRLIFVAVDATDLKTREPGLTGFTVYRSRNGGTPVAYTTPTVTELSSANMPGVYALTVDEDTTITAGVDEEDYCVHITHASMAPVTRTVELFRPKLTEGTTVTVAQNGVSLADGAVSAAALATAGGNKIADHVLRRTYANARASSDGDAVVFRSPMGMLSHFVNKWDVVGGNLVLKHEDDTTTFASKALTTDGAALAIVGMDP